jgi:hypothetical protein
VNEAEKKSVYISKCRQAFGSNHLCHYHMYDKKIKLSGLNGSEIAISQNIDIISSKYLKKVK